MGRINRVRRKPILNWCLTGLAIMALTSESGCAKLGNRLRRKPAPMLQASLAPPTIEGSAVRSQDASKLTRRVGSKSGAIVPPPAQPAAKAPTVIAVKEPEPASNPAREVDEPVVTVATPPMLVSERSSQVAPIPEPPELPADRTPSTLPSIASPTVASRGGSEDLIALSPSAVGSPASIVNSAPKIQEPVSPVAESVVAADDTTAIRTLIGNAKARLSQTISYQTRLRRQERVGTNLQPAEEVLLSIRREPVAVRLEWPNGTNKGREVLFSPVETNGKLQIYQPNSLMPRMTLNPESPLVLKNSRHPISEAGFDVLLRNLERSLDADRSGQPGGNQMSYQGTVEVAELGRACHQITEVRANGESWVVCLDAETLMPAMVRGQAADGALLEMYLFQDLALNVPELATETAFLADARWGKGGLLNRLAKAAAEPTESAESTTR